MSNMTNPTKDEAEFVAPNYDRKVDFQALAAYDLGFRESIQGNDFKVDFHDPQHLRSLTKALLMRDFKLKLYLPGNRLCPPVPVRWLYVQWVQSLINQTYPDFPGGKRAKRQVYGLDIGIGASCIYPLLMCTSRLTWNMFGTEIDETNYLHAVHNVSANELDERIKLAKTQADGPLIPLQALRVDRLDFTMCNPPFFASKEELNATYSKDLQPSSSCTGADVEMITKGGEIEYVSRMIKESCKLRGKVQWYTVQLGKLSSVHTTIQRLKDVGCSNWAIYVLQPGGQTVRWALGWSWDWYRAPDSIARHTSLVGSNVLTEPSESVIIKVPWNPQSLIVQLLAQLPLRAEQLADDALIIITNCAVWSRQEKRKRMRQGIEQASYGDGQATSNGYPRFDLRTTEYAFSINILPDHTAEADDHVIMDHAVHIRWLKGVDRAVFESFCGMLRGKIKEKSVDVNCGSVR